MSVAPEKASGESGSEKAPRKSLDRLIPFLSSFFIRLLVKTLRLRVVGEGRFKNERNSGNVIYAFWHNRLLLLIYTHRNQGIHVMVSRSRDGEIISQTIQRFGFRTVRGSSSRGGSSALLQLARKLADGADVAITPDGPQGPRYHVQMGIIHLAERSGCPIIPLAYSASKKWVLKSWDGFLIPCPFARAVLVYGNPLRVSRDSELEDKRLELEKELREITTEADAYYGGKDNGC